MVYLSPSVHIISSFLAILIIMGVNLHRKKTNLLGSFIYKASFQNKWGGWEELRLLKMDIFSFKKNCPVLTSSLHILRGFFLRFSRFGIFIRGWQVCKLEWHRYIARQLDWRNIYFSRRNCWIILGLGIET